MLQKGTATLCGAGALGCVSSPAAMPVEEESALDRLGTSYRAAQRLQAAGLRPTRQRLGLICVIFGAGERHVSAEGLFHEARAAGLNVALATIYNTLHQFAAVGLLRKVVVNTGQTFFDTNTSDHHHFFDARTGEVHDIPDGEVELARLPEPPAGFEVAHVDVVVHLRPKRGETGDRPRGLSVASALRQASVVPAPAPPGAPAARKPGPAR